MKEKLFVGTGKKTRKKFMGRVESGKVVAYFLLREEVKIPAKLGLENMWVKESVKITPLINQQANKVLSTKFKRI